MGGQKKAFTWVSLKKNRFFSLIICCCCLKFLFDFEIIFLFQNQLKISIDNNKFSKNVNLLFFFAWSCCTVCLRFINENSRRWCFDILTFDIFAILTNFIACCFIIVFWSLELLEFGFCGDCLFGLILCCTKNRDELFLGVQTSCIFDIHVVFFHIVK